MNGDARPHPESRPCANDPLVDVYLHGPLGNRFGFHHRLAVRTPRETVHALNSQYEGFLQQFFKNDSYAIHCDGDWREGEHAAALTFDREIHLVPVVEGQGPLLGMLVGAFIPALTTTTIFGVSAATIVGGLLFTGLLVGVSMLLSPKRKAVDSSQETKRDQNYAFTGPENVTDQGVAVPLIYGRVHAGSVVVSVALEPGQLTTTWSDVSVPASMNLSLDDVIAQQQQLVVRDQHHPLIAGMGGGGGKGGGAGSSHSPVEAPDNLKSHQMASLVDVVSEGPIRGYVGSARGVFFDGVPVQNADGSYNYSNFIIQYRNGFDNQPIMNGFASQQSEIAVGVQLRADLPVTRSIYNTDVDRIRVTLSTPALQSIDNTSGDISGSQVLWYYYVQNNGGGYQMVGTTPYNISGKTSSPFQRTDIIPLPRPGPWDIRIVRVTPNSTSQYLQNDLTWESFTEIIDSRVNYNLTACVGIQIDSEQFSSIPRRVYLVDGLYVRIPSNYDPFTATHYGPWDGTFVMNWTNNPAWVFYDLVVNNRYGIGDFVGAALIDKWALYAIATWCDTRVPDGKGYVQRRWTCNVQIMDQSDALDLLEQIASIFRGFAYWSGGQLIAFADQPADTAYIFTNANVIDGQFSYSGSDRRAKHTMVTVGWRDPAQLGETRLAIVEDQNAIARWGIQKKEVQAFGCTNEGEAIRRGNWEMYSDIYEGEAIQFSAALEGIYIEPGHIVQVMDALISGKRRGGRVGHGSTTTVIALDAPTPREPYTYYTMSCIMPDGRVETRHAGTGDESGLQDRIFTTAFSAAPAPDTVWVMTEPGQLESTLWRILSAKQTEPDTYELSGVRHYPTKWDYVEQHKALVVPDITDIVARPPAVVNLRIVEYLVATSPISVGVRVTLSWTSDAPMFDVFWRVGNDNWQHVRTDQKALDIATTEGPNQFTVTPIGAFGLKGPTSSLNYDVIGTFALPAAPRLFRVMVSDGIALFSWAPAAELDVIIGGHFELRHSNATSGALWNASQTVVPSIPGSASSVQTAYMPGTWMLRTFNIAGRASTTWALILAQFPDDRFERWIRICESPDWLGSKIYTEVLYPQEWLVIGQQSGLWDEQSDQLQPGGMDAWPDVDMLPIDPDAPLHDNWGTYRFDRRFDAGSVFPIRFSSEILAFPFGDPDEYFDSRLIDSDMWADWDDLSEDLQGQVQLLIRTTDDDPALAGASWGDWQLFMEGEYVGRGFEFQAVLSAPPGQNIGVETLCISGDFRNKTDHGEDIDYPAHDLTVWFGTKFYTVPAVVVTVQDAANTDDINVLDKTRENFTLRILNGGTQVHRVFDYQAQGY